MSFLDRPEWDAYFLGFAEWAAVRADCRRRKIGCVIVDPQHRIISTGYNGAPAGDPGCLEGACPRGLLTHDELAKDVNYDTGPGRCISLHAEANALLYAGREVRGGTAYVTDEPCPTCAKLLRGAGIERVVTPSSGTGKQVVYPGLKYMVDDNSNARPTYWEKPVTVSREAVEHSNIAFCDEWEQRYCGNQDEKTGFMCTKPLGHHLSANALDCRHGYAWVFWD